MTTKADREAEIRRHIPMDYLERHGTDTVAAMKDYAEDRWKLIERLQSAAERTAELEARVKELETLLQLAKPMLGMARTSSDLEAADDARLLSQRIGALLTTRKETT